MFGWIKTALRVGLAIKSFVEKEKKTDDGITFSEGVQYTLTKLIPMVDEQINAGKMSTKDEIISYFQLIDDTSGSDVGAFDMIPGVDPEDEEEIIGHILKAGCKYAFIRNNIKDPVPDF